RSSLMATFSPAEALEKAKAAAEAARQAAESAQTYAGQASEALGHALSAATGGTVDPTVFRLAIFVLAIFVGYYVVWSVTPALHGLSHPTTSRQGNRFGMIGMAIAVVTTLFVAPPSGFFGWLLVIIGIAIGGSVGAAVARRVPMTAMPQLVAAFHSLVGLAAVLVAAGALNAPSAFGIAE